MSLTADYCTYFVMQDVNEITSTEIVSQNQIHTNVGDTITAEHISLYTDFSGKVNIYFSLTFIGPLKPDL